MLSQQALDEVLEFQKTDGRRLGSLLVEKGLVNETQLTQILSHQLSVPWVALLHIEFSRQLLNLVPYEVAERFCLVPIYVRHVRGQGDTLYVAMDDPTNEEPLRECMKHSGLPVRAMIAPPSDIREAIRVCYGIEIAPPHSKAALTKPASQKTGETRAPEPPQRVPSGAPSSTGARSAQGSADWTGPDTRPPSTPRVAASEPAVPSRPPVSVPEVQSAPPLPDAAPSTSRSPDARPAARVSTPPPLPRPSSPGVVAPPPSPLPPQRDDADAPLVEAHEIEIPRSRRRFSEAEEAAASSQGGAPSSRGGARRMMSLTLLDGTTLSVPARASGPASVRSSALAGEERASAEADSPPEVAAPPEAGLTAHDVVEALRAACRGADASATTRVLGENARWEAMVAALLSLLLKKHLIQERELMEELKKLQIP